MASDGHSAALVGDVAIYVNSSITACIGRLSAYSELAGNWLTPLRASIVVETEFPAEHTCLAVSNYYQGSGFATEVHKIPKLSSVAGVRELGHAEGQMHVGIFFGRPEPAVCNQKY
jgi:hypothetical protein